MYNWTCNIWVNIMGKGSILSFLLLTLSAKPTRKLQSRHSGSLLAGIHIFTYYSMDSRLIISGMTHFIVSYAVNVASKTWQFSINYYGELRQSMREFSFTLEFLRFIMNYCIAGLQPERNSPQPILIRYTVILFMEVLKNEIRSYRSHDHGKDSGIFPEQSSKI